MLQEIVPGDDQAFYTFGAYHDAASRPLGQFISRKIRQHPRDFGESRIAVSDWVPDVAAASLSLLDELSYHGVSGTEFKRDPRDGRLKLMEVNARHWLHHTLATAAGVNLSTIAYSDAVGKPYVAPPQRDGVRWLDLGREARDTLGRTPPRPDQAAGGPQRLPRGARRRGVRARRPGAGRARDGLSARARRAAPRPAASTVTALGRIPTVRLNNGVGMPVLGLGLSPYTTEHRRFARFHMHVGRSTRDAVGWALELDYRLFDTASRYHNERDLGEAVRSSGVSRDEVFITSKCGDLGQGYDGVLRCCEASLRELQTDYVDLYLLHWPVTGRRAECWQAMQRLLEQGLCRAVGVSNFTIRHLQELAESSQIVPAVNQVEFSAFLYQRDLLAYCREHRIRLEGYCPLARASRLREPTLLALSAKHRVTPAQVLLRWALEHEVIVIPKSFNRTRIAENRDVFHFAFDADDMAVLDALDEGLRLNRDPTGVP